MNTFFPISLVALLTGIIVVGNYAIQRSLHIRVERCVRESLAWGMCFVVSAYFDYLVNISGAEYFIFSA